MAEAMMRVEIIYARADNQTLLSLDLAGGATIEAAIRQSGVLERFPEIDLATAKVGIFGKLNKLDTPLRDRDRIEIYRPLIADPKEVRKQRAAEGKRMKKGGGEAAEGD
jgi:uncharacterized protein